MNSNIDYLPMYAKRTGCLSDGKSYIFTFALKQGLSRIPVIAVTSHQTAGASPHYLMLSSNGGGMSSVSSDTISNFTITLDGGNNAWGSACIYYDPQVVEIT